MTNEKAEIGTLKELQDEVAKGAKINPRTGCPIVDEANKIDLSQFEGHTPGPWTYRYLQQSTGSTPEHTRRIAMIEDCSEAPERAGTGRTGYAIAKVDGPVTKRGGVEFDGNTILIAAAPDILAYAKALEKHAADLAWCLEQVAIKVTDLRPKGDGYHHRFTREEIQDIARVALAAWRDDQGTKPVEEDEPIS